MKPPGRGSDISLVSQPILSRGPGSVDFVKETEVRPVGVLTLNIKRLLINLQIVASLVDASRGVTYDQNFI
jgi:hypothetical protein